MKLEHSLTPYTKINSKWIWNINIRPDTIKLIEENIGRTLFHIINCSNIFSEPSPRVVEIKTKINKYELVKLKRVCTSKETTDRMKRQLTEWEKIFADDAKNERLVSRIYKQSSCCSIAKKQTT